MAIKDKAVTIKGAAAFVTSIQLYPKKNDPGCVIIVSGQTVDSDGRPVALKEAQIDGTDPSFTTIMSMALDALRKINGLEDGALPVEPKTAATEPAKP